MTTPGRLVGGRYRLQSQLGGGGMGTVWLARDELLGRQVAVKQVLAPSGAAPPEADQQRQRALREGRIAARLSHPHAISVYDVALESGQPWLVMEYLPSRSLATVLSEDGVLRVDQVAQIGAQVADALAATHAAGIVHRDVKPANILIGQGDAVEGLVKITDFGISHASGDVTLTQTGQITGTPAFLAPEVAQGREMTEASDVFALGATLYSCVEGQPPFGMEDNALGMLHRVAGGEIVPPRRAGSLTQPLVHMLAAEPADRPTMLEIRDELATLAAGRGGNTTTVLLARTDLRSPAPGTTLISPGPGNTDGGDGERRRGPRGMWVAVGAVAATLAGLIAFWAIALGGDQGSDATASPSTSPSTTSAEPGPTAQETDRSPADDAPADDAPAEDASDEPTADTPVDAGPVRARDVERALQDFVKQLPDHADKAYALTSPNFQDQYPLDDFEGFWGQFERVELGDVQAEDGSTTAAVQIEYVWPDDERQTELHQMTFVVGEDGRLLLDSDDYEGQAG
jgi:serine/threonine protein kinase